MAKVSDSFTDTDSTEITSHTGEGGLTWSYHPVSLDTAFILGNKLLSTNNPAAAFATIAYTSWLPSSPNYEVSAEIVSPDLGVTDTAASTAIAGRMDTTAETYYALRWRQSLTRWELLRVVSGTGAILATSASNPPSANVPFTLHLNLRGSQIEGRVDGVLLLQATDTTITAAGRAGVRLAHLSTATTGWQLDNFQGFLARGDALLRRRIYPAFDDEEVNRFEFWPAVTAGAAIHERSTSFSASASVEAVGESFSVFERVASISATADISGDGFSILERAVSISATATGTVAGARVVERAASIAATSTVEVSGQFFTILESALVLSATASIESALIFFSVMERAVVLNAVATVTATGTRVVDRAASLTATATTEATSQFFSVLTGTAQINATASIETSATFFSIFERQAAVASATTVTVTHQTEQQRQVALSATAAISVSGVVAPPSAVEHERSASLNGNGDVTVAGESFSVFQASSTLSATTTLSVSGHFFSSLQGSMSLTAVGIIEASAERQVERSSSVTATALLQVNELIVRERSAALNAAGLISVNSEFFTTLESATSLGGTTVITVSGGIALFTEYERSVLVSAGVSISVSGFIAAIVLHPTNVKLTNNGQSAAVINSGGLDLSINSGDTKAVLVDGGLHS